MKHTENKVFINVYHVTKTGKTFDAHSEKENQESKLVAVAIAISRYNCQFEANWNRKEQRIKYEKTAHFLNEISVRSHSCLQAQVYH